MEDFPSLLRCVMIFNVAINRDGAGHGNGILMTFS